MKQSLPIVILHGWGLSVKHLPLQQCLKSKATGYLLGLAGFGASKMPEHPLTLSDYARFLDEYLKMNQIVQPILIGHSFGGRVSLKYNELYPKHTRALILSELRVYPYS